MDRIETERVIELIEAMCPAQRFTDDTPKVWARPLMDVDLSDALAAVGELSTRQDFISPKDIVTEVRRVRAGRLTGFDVTAHLIAERFPETPEGHRQAQQALLAERRRIASGGQPLPLPELVARNLPAMEAAAGRTFKRVPRGS